MEQINIKWKLTAVLLFSLIQTLLHAQTMYVKQNNGTQTAYTLSTTKKIIFLSENISVTKTDNSIGIYALNTLRMLKFSDISTNKEEPLFFQHSILCVYPNPTNNLLNIDLTEINYGDGTLSILNFEGKTMLYQQLNNNSVNSFDISNLPNGIYLCRYNYATDVKTVKIVKF